MKTKRLIGIILIILLVLLNINVYEVKAYNGEDLDTENYIFLPGSIIIENKIGTGTITLSSDVEGYNLYYQLINISQELFDDIVEKSNAHYQYYSSSQQTITEKEEELEELEAEYNRVKEEKPENQENINAAKKAYDDALSEYEQYYDSVNEELERLQSQYYNLIPNYTSSWTQTTNTTNNVRIDLSSYTGVQNFVLWAKIENGEKTYYDFSVYSTRVVDTQEDPGDDSEEITWTDFSKAKIELKKDVVGAYVEVSNVTPQENSSYYIYILDNNTKPDLENLSIEDSIYMSYNTTTNKFVSSGDVSRYVELNKDMYLTIVEYREGSYNINVYGKKLTRYSEPKYYDAFTATFISHDSTQIVALFTHSSKNNRKMQIKIGKITDTNILQKFENKDESAFDNLLSYAKSNEAIYDKNVNTKNDTSRITYDQAINLDGIEDGEYYYLYVKTDGENGKYISNEAVTLARANSYTTGEWYLDFYDEKTFDVRDYGDTNSNGNTNENTKPDEVKGNTVENPKVNTVDETTAKGKIPQTGTQISIVISAFIILTIVGIIAYKKYKEYDF